MQWKLVGPKWCGRDMDRALPVSEALIVWMMWQFSRPLQTDPALVLMGRSPIWWTNGKMYRKIWDAARRHIDDNANRKGQLILTGSAIPKDRDAIHHSGTGRIARLRMWPMSLAESGESTGAVQLHPICSRGN